MYIFNPMLVKHIWLYLKNSGLQSVYCDTLFWVWNCGTWHHSYVIFGWLLIAITFSSGQIAWNWCIRRSWKFGDDLPIRLGAIAKKEGAKIAPSRARVKIMLTFISIPGKWNGYGVGVECWVGVGPSRQFWPESASESIKFYRLRLRPRSQKIVFHYVKFRPSERKYNLSRIIKVVSNGVNLKFRPAFSFPRS